MHPMSGGLWSRANSPILIIVDGKPDRRIGDTRRIAVVMKEGALIDRTALRLGSLAHPGLSGDRLLDGARVVASSISN